MKGIDLVIGKKYLVRYPNFTKVRTYLGRCAEVCIPHRFHASDQKCGVFYFADENGDGCYRPRLGSVISEAADENETTR